MNSTPENGQTADRLNRRRRVYRWLAIGTMVIGLCLAAWPLVSSFVQSSVMDRLLGNYETAVSVTTDQEKKEQFEKARAYNEKLNEEGDFLLDSSLQIPGYEQALNLMEDGVMGSLSIPKIDLDVPIYHGTSDAVLTAGIGHLQGSSLPTGEKGDHVVLSGHRGLPNAMMFTRLDELKQGDQFSLQILGKKMYYEVNRIQVIWPSQIDQIARDPEADEVTLVTCTPFGVNNKRLLVTGVRTEAPKEQKRIRIGKIQWIFLAASALMADMLLWRLISYWRKRQR